MTGRSTPLRVALCILALSLLRLSPAGLAAAQDDPAPTVDPKWLERLDQVDRYLLNELVGYAPPAIPEDLAWAGTGKTTWEEMRGKVIIVQSWSNRSSGGRKALSRMERLARDHKGGDVRTLLVHTPEGVDKLDAFLKRRQIEMPMAIDPTGAFCDAMGFFRRPVNVVIGRNGAVRYVGLNARGLKQAVELLLEEPFEATKLPSKRPQKADEPEDAEYPPITGTVANAADIRGRTAPDFHVDDWMTAQPNARGRVVVIEFWETTSQPSIAAVGHMNTLAATLGGDICFVAISDDEEWEFKKNLRKTGRPLDEYRYALAVDSSETMKRAAGVRGVPHCLVMSSDWIVRWQGNPRNLTSALLLQIARANAGRGRQGPVTVNRNRWTGGG